LRLVRDALPDVRPATMPTTAPATLPAIDATPLATLVAPVTNELAGRLPVDAFAAFAADPPEFSGPFEPGLAVFVVDLAPADAFDAAFAEAFGLAVPEDFAGLGASAALVRFGDAFFPDAADFASFDRSAIAAPAPVLASRGLAVFGFFSETVRFIWCPSETGCNAHQRTT
jgi:hypothetical protein